MSANLPSGERVEDETEKEKCHWWRVVVRMMGEEDKRKDVTGY